MSANSQVTNEPAKCTLVIDNFSQCTTKESVPFGTSSDTSNSSSTFLLCMNPCVDMSKTTYWGGKYCSFSLFQCQASQITVHYRISIVGRDGQMCNTQEGKIKYRNAFQYRVLYIIARDDLLDFTNDWLNNDKLTVHCEIYTIDSDFDQSISSDNSIHKSGLTRQNQSTMFQDYETLFESCNQSDAILVASDGTEFPVHKLILSTRSPVFKAMFEHETREREENRVEFDDMSPEVCRELIRYIYTDKVEKLDQNALDLLAASDKYQLEYLKSICEQYLCSHLSTESVTIVLVVADLIGSETLKSKCIKYISENGREVRATEGWKTLSTKPEILTELFLHLSDKQRI